MLSRRASGILLHPTSLPGQFGSGDIGDASYKFVDWLVKAGQTYWQMLPVGEVGPSNSPYTSCSAFAGNHLLIDLEELAKLGWLKARELIPDSQFNSNHVDFELVKPFRLKRLQLASKRFFSNSDRESHDAYTEFCKSEQHWLEDFALFKAIAHHHQDRAWNQWPLEYASRNPEALAHANSLYADEVDFYKFCQWCFYRQWKLLKTYANDRGVKIVGDVPIFVSYQSADVWEHQELFELDARGNPTVVAGVPPDFFSETGQLWGNPLYRWRKHERTNYAWWIARMAHALRYFDLVRIDHFRGFAGYWAIPAGAPDARGGQWMPGPGKKLFKAFQKAFDNLPIIAEDLGLITPDVLELRDRFKLPGMRILQFAFGGNDSNTYLPHHYIENTVAYTGTHDNDTTIGWWHSAPEHEKNYARYYLATGGHDIHWVTINALSASRANTVIFPLQDVLGLSSDCRMNIPGNAWGNWEWRFTLEQLQDSCTQRLEQITAANNRNPRITH